MPVLPRLMCILGRVYHLICVGGDSDLWITATYEARCCALFDASARWQPIALGLGQAHDCGASTCAGKTGICCNYRPCQRQGYLSLSLAKLFELSTMHSWTSTFWRRRALRLSTLVQGKACGAMTAPLLRGLHTTPASWQTADVAAADELGKATGLERYLPSQT